MTSKLPQYGVTPRELTPGTHVMVVVGAVAAAVNGGPCIVAYAVVIGLAVEGARPEDVKPDDLYWLDLYMIPGGPPVPQQYRAREILGIPALGLSMDGAPPRSLSAS